MDGMYYYSAKPITLNDIKECVINAGYDASFQSDNHKNDPRLYITPDVEVPTNQRLYWRWETVSVNISDLDVEEREYVEPIWADVKSTFAVWYPMTAMKEFGEVMRQILECYNGYVFFEYVLYDKENILSISGNVPSPPSELVDD